MKQFKLPKEFAEKWCAALRSGTYEQGENYLAQPKEEEKLIDNAEDCTFCCLGVAGIIFELPLSKLTGIPTYGYGNFADITIPDEIKGTSDENLFVKILSRLNDGMYPSYYIGHPEYKELIFRRSPTVHWIENPKMTGDHHAYKLTFAEIADFIEDNCEFYTQETT